MSGKTHSHIEASDVIMRLRFLLLFAFIAAISTFTATAQTGAPSPRANGTRTATPPNTQSSPIEQSDTEIKLTTRRVNLPITVLDKKGLPVAGLTQSDFLIFEDKQPQAIDSFAVESSKLPLYVGVLMDTSSSTAGKLKFQQESAMNFIHTVVRIRKDQVAFATFDDEITVKQDFTTKLDLLDKAVYSVKKPGAHTSLYDAIYRFCDEKMRGVRGLRALVIVTDGDDTYSRATMREAIEMAQATETMVFAISTKSGLAGSVPGVDSGTVKDGGDKILDQMCQETGGRAFFTGDVLELERSFARIAKELRSQYIVTYRPTNERFDGSDRKIEVRLAQKKGGMKVRTRGGYKATPDALTQQ